MKNLIAAVSTLILISGTCRADGLPPDKNEKTGINYSVGYQIGSDFSRQGIELDAEALVRGIKDALTKTTPWMTQEEMHKTLTNLKKKIVSDQVDGKKQTAGMTRFDVGEYMTENGKKEGVRTLPSGVQYKVISEGSGKKPGLKDTVTVKFRSSLPNGTELDSTYRDGNPRTYLLDKAIPGLKEVLPMMKEGSTWRIFVPATLAFGSRSPLAEQGVVIYDMELVSVQPAI